MELSQRSLAIRKELQSMLADREVERAIGEIQRRSRRNLELDLGGASWPSLAIGD
jgi:hypothetical protein